MKWIGQHIYDKISRFRNEVYLESISASTETDMLVVDSAGKITKRAIDAITVDVSDFMTNGVNNRILTATGADAINAEANLTFNGSTLSVEADANTTVNALLIDANSLTTGSAVLIDVDDALTASSTKSLMHIDYDKVGATPLGQVSVTTGLQISMNDLVDGSAEGYDNGGVSLLQGLAITCDHASNSGLARQGGIAVTLTDADADTASTIGYRSTIEDGGVDIKMFSSTDTSHKCDISTGVGGKTIIETSGTTGAHIELTSAGSVILDSAVDIALEAGGGDITMDTENVTITSTTTGDPVVALVATHTDKDASGELRFKKDAADTEDGENLGKITWFGEDEGNNNTQFAGILAEISESAEGDEAGRLSFSVAESDSTNTAVTVGLKLEGEHNIDGQVDVTIAAGAASTTTVAGNLTVTGTLVSFGGSNANIEMNAGSDIILEADNAGGGNASSIQYLDAGGGNKIMLAVDNDVVQLCNRASNGTVTIKANTSTAGSGGETLAATFTDTETTIAGDLDVTGDLTVNGDAVTFQSSDDSEPIVSIKNTNSNDSGAELRFVKDKGAAGAASDEIGIIKFIGDNAAQEQIYFAHIRGGIDNAGEGDGSEGGAVKIAVASHDGELQNGLVIQDGNAEDEVDVQIASGSASITTIAGTLTMGSTAAMGNTGLLTVGAQTGITAAANLVTVGAIGTGTWESTDIAVAHGGTGASNLDAFCLLAGSQTLTGTKTLNSFKGTGATTVTNILDEDAMGSNSATALATQQSIKAYVDTYKIHVIQTSFNDDMGTDEIFIPFNHKDENPNITNINVPMVMPVAGKLLKIHLRANQHQNLSSNEITFKLYDIDTGENWNTDNSDVLGAKVITGLAKQHHTTADFTTGLESGVGAETNIFQAGDIIGVTMQHSADQNASNTSNYLVTFVFELNFAGY